jgi:hypothetical protein
MAAILSLVFALSLPAADPSRAAEEAVRLAGVAARFDTAAFSGSYLRTTRTQVVTAGALLLDEVETVRVVVRNGRRTTEMIRATASGSDVTDERRGSDSTEHSAPPATPSLSTPDGLVFRTLDLGIGACAAAFASGSAGRAPQPDGKLAWDCGTGTPLWAEFRPVDAPAELAEPRARLEFSRAGEILYASRYTLEGRVEDRSEAATLRLVQEISGVTPDASGRAD